MIEVIYYYYFQFYSKIKKDSDPHLLTIFAISAGEGFPLVNLVNITIIKLYGHQVDKLILTSIILIVAVINYYHFYKSGRSFKILQAQPTIFQSRSASIVFTVLFFIVTLSTVLLGPIYARNLMDELGH